MLRGRQVEGVVSRPAPGKVRPAHQIDADAGEEFGLGREVGAILSALQGRDSRGRWLWGRYSELLDHTVAGFRGALQRGAAEVCLERLPGAVVVMLPSLNADGTCSCVLGARCPLPGAHPRRNAQGEVMRARWAGDVAVMQWEAARVDLALEMGPVAGLVAVTAGPGADMPAAWCESTFMVATAVNGARTFIYRRPDGRSLPSAALREGVQFHGDGAFVRVPPSFGPHGISIGWDVSDDGGPLELPLEPGPLPRRILWHATRTARRLS